MFHLSMFIGLCTTRVKKAVVSARGGRGGKDETEIQRGGLQCRGEKGECHF